MLEPERKRRSEKMSRKRAEAAESKLTVSTPNRYELGKGAGAIVEKLQDSRTGRSAVIRLDKGSMTFSCEIGGVIARSKDGRVVRDWAKAQLEKTDEETRLSFFPVIEVRATDRERHSYYRGDRQKHALIGFTIDRFYVAEKVIGHEWVQLKWHQADPRSAQRIPIENQRVSAEPFWQYKTKEHGGYSTPFHVPIKRDNTYEGDVYYLPYTEATWAGLKHLLKVIENSSKTLEEMLSTAKGNAVINAIGEGKQPATALLGAGS
jgi:hypothetical protein